MMYALVALINLEKNMISTFNKNIAQNYYFQVILRTYDSNLDVIVHHSKKRTR